MSAALPEGVFHLLTADDDVTSNYMGYVTVCGEVAVPSDLPPSSCSPEGSEREPRYCPACVREAARWSAEVGDRIPEAVNCPPGIYARTAR